MRTTAAGERQMMAGAMLSVRRRYADDSVGRKIAGSLGGRVVLLPEVVVRSAALSLLIRQSHDESQGDIEARDVFVVEMSDLLSDSFASNRHRLVRHHLRSHAQASSGVKFGNRLDPP
jgi:hypothetical protein